ncbi:DUF4150 domain-containing protein [Chelativorans salis]|uniref:DUF4150 domain-containing protein n=1 Tax=Chelativorans salis TaxID=2978478 RepID=A0ABT2LLU2_9HYPH|nr:DUF4150 domain-containing protein [Chelativorans sp. EGI FJ00035]MCT7374149.1 DUF4150 domain-containing protein [Chelativorans sp. EGI FJ00035]
MSNVFANGLGVSGKATDGKTIAAFPDTCFTPPENPATPPGVPVPYPSFGMAGDTESGTGTVFIGGKIVNIKNKSDLSKTSGTEAGCAAKKGAVTSKNTGKEYFNSWSNNVKFDGEPVIRMSDLATNNHASPVGNTPPWAHVLGMNIGNTTCAQVLIDCGLQLHKHQDSPCKSPDQSEHMVQNAFFQNKRGGASHSIPDFANYSKNTAPCICMEGPGHAGADTPHGRKTSAQLKFAQSCGTTRPTVKQAVDNEMQNVRENHPAIKNDEKSEWAMECLEAVVYAYLEEASGKKGDDLKQTRCRVPGGEKISDATPVPASPL